MKFYDQHPVPTRPAFGPNFNPWSALIAIVCLAPVGLVWLVVTVRELLGWLR